MSSIDRFCLLVGAMKSGTTTLYKQLVQHPELARAAEKEPNFFSRAELRARGRLWYESLWEFDPTRHAWAIEASTEYAKLPTHPSAAFAAASFEAEFRILYVVRDPVERLRSHLRHGIAQGWITRGADEGLVPELIAYGNYAMQLWPYRQAFAREQLLVLDQRDLLTDTEGTLRRVCRFLGVDETFDFRMLPHQNTGGYFARQGIARFLQEKRLLPPLISVKGVAKLAPGEFEVLCRNFCRDAGKPEGYAEAVRAYERAVTPSPEQERGVREALRDDLERFQDDWGVDPWSEESRALLGSTLCAA